MSVKKLLVLTAAGIATVGMTAAMAGGPDKAAAPAQPEFQPYVYVEGNVGYAYNDWTDMGINTALTNYGSGDKGGFTFGGDLGYMFTRHLGLELGAFYLPRVRNAAGTSRINSWFAYAAGKLMVPLFDNFDVFAKAGVAYRQLRFSGAIAATPNNQYWRPVAAVGAQYVLDNAWIFDVQYMYLPGYFRVTPTTRRAPNVHSFTFSLGYMFSV